MDEKLLSTYADVHLRQIHAGKMHFPSSRFLHLLSLLILSMLFVAALSSCASAPEATETDRHPIHSHENTRL